MADGAEHEQLVKGLTFETARRHLTQQFGERAWQSLMDDLPRRTRSLFDEAQTSEWYPEAELRRFIHVLHAQLAEGDDERFAEIARALALAGISRFFRMVVGLASARFVLLKVPVVWKRLRQGPAKLHTEIADDARVLVHYENYRYCRDPIYRQLSIANCQALVVAATNTVPPAAVLRHDSRSMTLAFELLK
ncbi:hypothetical protein ENSA7_25450 [Enhygromyxa salina]|uniref:Uncharacterized protein n=2 Tax=Enhygromyxa salina TaxID=215803 RepID=A0A2S9YR30_9BACT|nr:hypothetical protein ENSA7_25450 [Enhygromyxa salina]